MFSDLQVQNFESEVALNCNERGNSVLNWHDTANDVIDISDFLW